MPQVVDRKMRRGHVAREGWSNLRRYLGGPAKVSANGMCWSFQVLLDLSVKRKAIYSLGKKSCQPLSSANLS